MEIAYSENCTNAFEEIKRVLTNSPVLAVYNQKRMCYLFTDASGIGVGDVIKQMQEDNELHPIGYYSKSLKQYQKNYTASELELLAIAICMIRSS